MNCCPEERKKGTVLFKDALNILYIGYRSRTYATSKESSLCTIPQTKLIHFVGHIYKPQTNIETLYKNISFVC